MSTPDFITLNTVGEGPVTIGTRYVVCFRGVLAAENAREARTIVWLHMGAILNVRETPDEIRAKLRGDG